MSEIRFSCTLCGRCCHGHSLPLTLQEAISWLEDGGKVEIFCEAHVYESGDVARAEHHSSRSFPVQCGTGKIHVTAIFVGIIDGPCRNLLPDMKCRIYERRPLVCRIYPAEINPFIQINPAAKACPEEAWSAGAVLVSGDGTVDAGVRELIEKSRRTDREEAVLKQAVCRALNINRSAISGEGFISWEPDQSELLEVLKNIHSETQATCHLDPWTLHSPHAATTDLLWARGFQICRENREGAKFLYAPPVREMVSSPSL